MRLRLSGLVNSIGAVDVLVLIDRLDELVQGAKAVPLTDQVRLEREQINVLLDELRAAIPDEVKQARFVVRERQATLAEAEREAERLLAEAREQASRASARTEVVRLAERHADELTLDARRQAHELLSEVEDRAEEHLAVLEANLANFLDAIRRGRERLRQRSQETVVAGIRANGTSGRAATPS